MRARFITAALSLLALAGCGSTASGGATHVVGGSQRVAAPGASPLTYAARTCRVDGVALALHALTPDAALELRVLQSPTARRDQRCRHRFGGDDLPHTPLAALGIEPLGAVNGWFFSRLPDGSSRSNGSLWSRLATGPRLLAPLASTEDPDMHGGRLVVADARGLHELRLAAVSDAAVQSRAAVLTAPLNNNNTLAALIPRLFPSATMAMQLVATLPDAPVTAETPAQERVAAGWRCPTDRSAPDAWNCERQAVSVLCGGADGRVSLLSVEPARYWEIVEGLRAGGASAPKTPLPMATPRPRRLRLRRHPENWDEAFGLVEVFNDSSFDENLTRSVKDWFSFLSAGRRVYAVGSSDSHEVSDKPVGYPRTCIEVGTDSPTELRALGPNGVRDPLVAGHATVSGGIYVTAVARGGAGPGDDVTGSAARESVDVTVRAAPWIRVTSLRSYVDGALAETIPLDAATVDPLDPTLRFRGALDVTVTAAGGVPSYAIFVAAGDEPMEPVHPGRMPFGVTNPIFFAR